MAAFGVADEEQKSGALFEAVAIGHVVDDDERVRPANVFLQAISVTIRLLTNKNMYQLRKMHFMHKMNVMLYPGHRNANNLF